MIFYFYTFDNSFFVLQKYFRKLIKDRGFFTREPDCSRLSWAKLSQIDQKSDWASILSQIAAIFENNVISY